LTKEYHICHFICLVCFLAVYFMAVVFGSGVDLAILESPVYGIDRPVCLEFYYHISTPKIELTLFNKLASEIAFDSTRSVNLTYANQPDATSWNFASVPMAGGVNRLRFVARKFGVTSDGQMHQVQIDRIVLRLQSDDCFPATSMIYTSFR